ncbi:T-cell surface antigen CD2-like isoform X2 [Sceloporus undulatus]|uniref:T-cell surface antigen CD2-like isoform X2 n=1 Tax=Sceloporus undulatus TaxID=8520 RepID=UPI001C4BDBCE|nr:T-cell surface antigen CD2-like isoform X2 [Sceloporus undulatus]
MKWGTISLITFLMAFPFGLKGVASSSVEVHGILGDTVLLPAPEFTGTPFRIQWLNVTSGKSTLILRKQWNTPSEDSEKYNILNNGSLTIDNLVKEDAGNYKVDGHNKSGAALFKETTVTLKVHDRLPQPLLIENCSDKSLICQVEPSSSQKLKVTLFQNNKLKINQEPNHANGTWRWTFQQSSLVGKFKCEIASDHIKNQNEKEINCLGPDQEKELQAWIANDDLKHRKLPQPPVHAVPNQAPQQQQRLPLVRSEQHQPGGPPQPCPRPPQRKPPRRMKEGP